MINTEKQKTKNNNKQIKMELAIIKLSGDLQDIILGWPVKYKHMKERSKSN